MRIFRSLALYGATAFVLTQTTAGYGQDASTATEIRSTGSHRPLHVAARAGYTPLLGAGVEASYELRPWWSVGVEWSRSSLSYSSNLDDHLGQGKAFDAYDANRATIDARSILITQRFKPFERFPSFNMGVAFGYRQAELDYEVERPEIYRDRAGNFRTNEYSTKVRGRIHSRQTIGRVTLGNIWKLGDRWLLGADWIGYAAPLTDDRTISHSGGLGSDEEIEQESEAMFERRAGVDSPVALLLYAGSEL